MTAYQHIVDTVLAAEQRIRPNIRTTLLDHSLFYSERIGAQVHFKCENLQHTGSFKARGSLNKILSLSDAERNRGIVTASSGNHGAGVAFSMARVGASGIVFVPETVDPSKAANIERLGAEIRYFGNDSALTEMHARQFAEENGMTYVSPYNDIDVMGGQGTIGVELARQLEQIDAVFVSVGGGGLIGGMAAYLKSVRPKIRIIGCQPENSQMMAQSVAAGQILDLPSLPTLSDGTAGGIEPGAITFAVNRDLVDQFVTVSEAEIADSMRTFIGAQHMLIEGAAGVAIASLEKHKAEFAEQTVVVLLCGANLSMDTLKQVLNG